MEQSLEQRTSLLLRAKAICRAILTSQWERCRWTGISWSLLSMPTTASFIQNRWDALAVWKVRNCIFLKVPLMTGNTRILHISRGVRPNMFLICKMVNLRHISIPTKAIHYDWTSWSVNLPPNRERNIRSIEWLTGMAKQFIRWLKNSHNSPVANKPWTSISGRMSKPMSV